MGVQVVRFKILHASKGLGVLGFDFGVRVSTRVGLRVQEYTVRALGSEFRQVCEVESAGVTVSI